MDYKMFKIMKLVVVLSLSTIIGVFVSAGNIAIPIIAIVAAAASMFVLKKNVNEAITDERVEKVSGRAAYITYSTSAIVIALIAMSLMVYRNNYPELVPVAYAFSYLGCGMIILYVILFKYFDSRNV